MPTQDVLCACLDEPWRSERTTGLGLCFECSCDSHRTTPRARLAAMAARARRGCLPSAHDREPVVRLRLGGELQRVVRKLNPGLRAPRPDVRHRPQPGGVVQGPRLEHDELGGARRSPEARMATTTNARFLATAIGQLDEVLARLASNDREVLSPRDHVQGEARTGLPLTVGAMARVQGERSSLELVLDFAAEAGAVLREADHRSPDEWALRCAGHPPPTPAHARWCCSEATSSGGGERTVNQKSGRSRRTGKRCARRSRWLRKDQSGQNSTLTTFPPSMHTTPQSESWLPSLECL